MLHHNNDAPQEKKGLIMKRTQVVELCHILIYCLFLQFFFNRKPDLFQDIRLLYIVACT